MPARKIRNEQNPGKIHDPSPTKVMVISRKRLRIKVRSKHNAHLYAIVQVNQHGPLCSKDVQKSPYETVATEAAKLR